MMNIVGTATNEDPTYRYKMPRVVAKIEGRGNGIKTVIVNMADIATAINRPAVSLCGTVFLTAASACPRCLRSVVNVVLLLLSLLLPSLTTRPSLCSSRRSLCPPSFSALSLARRLVGRPMWRRPP